LEMKEQTVIWPHSKNERVIREMWQTL
jgi:hypothetical protein